VYATFPARRKASGTKTHGDLERVLHLALRGTIVPTKNFAESPRSNTPIKASTPLLHSPGHLDHRTPIAVGRTSPYPRAVSGG
jgi:hypothetical protein